MINCIYSHYDHHLNYILSIVNIFIGLFFQYFSDNLPFYESISHFSLKKVISMVGPITYETHDEDPFEFLVHEIIEQMLSVKAGNKIFSRLVNLCDGKITPEKIALLSINQIKGIVRIISFKFNRLIIITYFYSVFTHCLLTSYYS